MERRGALALSGAAHAGLLVWALIAGWFDTTSDEESLRIASVGIVSEAEFDALVSRTPGPSAPAPEAPAELDAPEVSEPPQPVEEPTPPPPPPEDPPEAETVAPPEAPPPPPAAEDAPVADRPSPRAAERIAPIPTPAPPPLVEEAPTLEALSEPSEEPSPDVPEEPQEQTAPEETTTAEVTEADEPAAADLPAIAPSRAPEASERPGRRPDRPAPAEAIAATEPAETPPAPEQAPAVPASEPRQVDTSDALREALAGGGSAAQEGVQLSDGAREGFRLAVQACWDLGAVSTDVLRTVVEVRFEMREDGFPVSSSIRLEGSRGGDDVSTQVALDRARQAIIGCSRANGGYDLPAESYSDWRDIVITFDPTRR